MPVIWGRHNRSQIFVEVVVLRPDYTDRLENAPSEDIALGIGPFNALVDTGATSTCITRRAAETVGLSPIGKVPVVGVSGPVEHNNYAFLIGFPITTGSDEAGNPTGQVQALNQVIQGVEFFNGDTDWDVLLGMDVISKGSLKVDGDGSFSFGI